MTSAVKGGLFSAEKEEFFRSGRQNFLIVNRLIVQIVLLCFIFNSNC